MVKYDDNPTVFLLISPSQMPFFGGYPLVNVYITMENHHAINGQIHYK